jgi:hypothetical protein
MRQGMAAFNLLSVLVERTNLDAALAFYGRELRVPAAAAKAPESARKRRANAAANLAIAIARRRGRDAARAFCESELKRPAEAAGASDDERSICNQVMAALKF